MEKGSLPRFRRQASNIRGTFHSGASMTLGAIQITFAILLSIFAFASIAAASGLTKHEAEYENHIEGELMAAAVSSLIVTIVCLASGILAITAARRKTNCLIIAHMVLSILAAICVFSVLSRTAGILAKETAGRGDRDDDSGRGSRGDRGSHDDGRHPRPDGKDHGDDWDEHYDYEDDSYGMGLAGNRTKPEIAVCFGSEWKHGDLARTWVALTAMVVIVAFVEFVALLWSSSLTCRATCCAPHSAPVHPQPDMMIVNGQKYPVVCDGPVVMAGLDAKALEAQEVYRAPDTPPPPY